MSFLRRAPRAFYDEHAKARGRRSRHGDNSPGGVSTFRGNLHRGSEIRCQRGKPYILRDEVQPCATNREVKASENAMKKLMEGLIAGFYLIALSLASVSAARSAPPESKGNVHTYYVAADEVDWDYAPDGIDKNDGDEVRRLRCTVYATRSAQHRQS